MRVAVRWKNRSAKELEKKRWRVDPSDSKTGQPALCISRLVFKGS